MTRAPDHGEPNRRVIVRTTHDQPAVIANAVAPDNTDEMDTRIENRMVVTTIHRETTGGLQSTVDDYVVNIDVASQVVQLITEPSTDTNTNPNQ